MKKVILIGLCILLFGILFLMLRSGREVIGDLQITGGSFIEDISIVHKQNGIPDWTLTAERADFKEGEHKAELKYIKFDIPKNEVVLYADAGIYDFSAQTFATEGIARAEAKDYTIIAESIDYEISTGSIKANGRIKVESKGFNIEGKGLITDAGQKVTILNDVKATFHK